MLQHLHRPCTPLLALNSVLNPTTAQQLLLLLLLLLVLCLHPAYCEELVSLDTDHEGSPGVSTTFPTHRAKAQPNGNTRVTYCRLEGNLPVQPGAKEGSEDAKKREDVRLHMYMRVVIVKRRLFFRSTTFGESLADPTARAFQRASIESKSVKRADIKFKLRSLSTNDIVPLKWQPNKHFVYLHGGNLSSQEPDEPRYDLEAEGLQGECSVQSRTLQDYQLSPLFEDQELNTQKPKTTWWVKSSFLIETPKAADHLARQFKWHFDFHQRMGLTKTLFYIMRHHPLHKDFYSNPYIQEMMQRGQLNCIAFAQDFKYDAEVQQGVYVDQVAQYEHAVISAWLEPVVLMIADIDELIFMHKPMSIVQAMQECSHTPGRVAINKMWVIPSSCPDCDSYPSEQLAWANETLTRGQSPVLMYVFDFHNRSDGSYHNDKGVVDPLHLIAPHIHNSFTLTGPSDEHEKGVSMLQNNASCWKVMHMVNYYKRREWKRRVKQQDLSWWWPLAPLMPRWAERELSNG